MQNGLIKRVNDMAHCRLLFVGTKDNMEAIFENCSDSSSESKAEMAFDCDYIAPDYWYDEEFTKQSEYYQHIIEGRWVYCYDIRNINHYGDYACLNNLNYNNEKEYTVKIIEHIKDLPENTIFFFQDSHF